MTTKLLGQFAVDSGQVMIGDPCYLSRWTDNHFEDVRIYTNGKDTFQFRRDFHNYEDVIPKYGKTMNQLLQEDFKEVKQEPSKEYSYDGACQATCSDAQGGELIVSGLATTVVSTTGYGDGIYPVHATYNEEGRCIKLTITFDDFS